jgi:hypothetical protein
MHRYSSIDQWRPLVAVGVGVGWYLGRASVRLGFDYEWIDADPPVLPGWIREGEHYDHAVPGLLLACGVKVR